jgi:hypothetical protein
VEEAAEDYKIKITSSSIMTIDIDDLVLHARKNMPISQ